METTPFLEQSRPPAAVGAVIILLMVQRVVLAVVAAVSVQVQPQVVVQAHLVREARAEIRL
jgi:hypothetical protein